VAYYNNILIIQTAFIGDAILASSLIEKLHAEIPSANISILVRKGNESIYANHPFLKEVLVWNKQENKIKNLFNLLFRIRKNKYDCVVNCHRFASSGFLTAFSGAKHTAGYKENPFSFSFNFAVKHSLVSGKHEIERYTQLVEDFAGEKIYEPKLYPSAQDYEHIKSLSTEKYICIAPASVWFTKQVPVKKWVELCDKISPDTIIYLLGAPSDTDLCEEIIKTSVHPKMQSLAGSLSLLQSAALMKSATMNYVNDSAPLHLASALNAPVTAIFCSTIPEFGFGPRSTNSKILQVAGLPCKPCGVHGHKQCPQQHFKCGYDLNLSNVLKQS